MSKLNLYSMLLAEGQRQGLTDPTVMLSLAHAEDGVPGYEMGYGTHDPKWRGAERQVFGSVGMVKQLEGDYTKDSGQAPSTGDGSYTQEFLYYLAHGQAATGGSNPEGYQGRYGGNVTQNNNYFSSVADIYYQLRNRPDLLEAKDNGRK